MKVSKYDNVKPSKTGATAIKRWGCGVVGREGGGGKGGGGKRGGGKGECPVVSVDMTCLRGSR